MSRVLLDIADRDRIQPLLSERGEQMALKLPAVVSNGFRSPFVLVKRPPCLRELMEGRDLDLGGQGHLRRGAPPVAAAPRAHGSMPLRDVTVELALEWMGEHRWTLGGIRAMFSDARRVGLVDTNPFADLRLRGSRGRKGIDVLARGEVDRLAEYALEVWSGEVALTIRALILIAAFVGMRPAELYGLRWSDIDIRADEIKVERQYSASTRSFELPKNGKTRTIVLTAPAKAGLLAMPRPVDGDAMIFRGKKGGVLTGRTQHYYWHPVRCRFGKPSAVVSLTDAERRKP